jgi:hypothetical protein
MITEYELYSDERYEGQNKLLLGGLVVTDAGRERIARRLGEVRSQYSLVREMRWGKVSKEYLGAYKEWVETFFSDPFARFSCLIVDLSSGDWKQFRPSGGRRPKRDAKLASVFYQFLLVTFGPLRETKRWWVYPDAGFFSKEETLDRIEFLFNRTYKKAFGPKTSRIIRLTRSTDSKKEDLIQLADIILAALSYSDANVRPVSEARNLLLGYFEERMREVSTTQRGLPKVSCRDWMLPQDFTYQR